MFREKFTATLYYRHIKTCPCFVLKLKFRIQCPPWQISKVWMKSVYGHDLNMEM